jgi:hypothetical protein
MALFLSLALNHQRCLFLWLSHLLFVELKW